MGLDQYAYAVMPSGNNTDFSYDWDINTQPDKVDLLVQWRKHPNLQKWMEDLYIKKSQEQGREVVTDIEITAETARMSAMVLNTETGDMETVEDIFVNEETKEQLESGILDKLKEEFSNDMTISDFNQQPLRLTLEDLDQLELAIKEDKLPMGEGPFWGVSLPQHKEETLKFILKARWAIWEGLEVYYDSWW